MKATVEIIRIQAVVLVTLIGTDACLAQGMKTQNISFGSLNSISVPASWVRSQERAVLPASLIKFAPSGNSRYGIFVFDAGLPMSTSADQNVYDAKVTSPVALTPDQIQALSSKWGNVGDNQYSNKRKWPDVDAPLFQISTAQAVSVNGKVVVKLDGSFVDPTSGQPKLSFVGLFTPSEIGTRRMISMYTQSQDQNEFSMFRSVFDNAVNSIVWNGVSRTSEGVPAHTSVSASNYADELTDWGIPSQTTLKYDVGSRTPMEIPGARRITTQELQQLGKQTLLIDVLADRHDKTIPGAIYAPGAGKFGRFDDQVQSKLVKLLSGLVNGDINRPIVFFCEGALCWESYNAALRAVKMGLRNVMWYRGGLASWTEANLSLVAFSVVRPIR